MTDNQQQTGPDAAPIGPRHVIVLAHQDTCIVTLRLGPVWALLTAPGAAQPLSALNAALIELAGDPQ